MTPDMPALVSKLVLDFAPMTPETINEGCCGAFAEELCRILWKELGVREHFEVDSDVAVVRDEKGRFVPKSGVHVWLYFAGRHYDSEAPEGVTDWLDLPFWKRKVAEGWTVERRYSAEDEAKMFAATKDFVTRCREHIERDYPQKARA